MTVDEPPGFDALPMTAAWLHQQSRSGFEVGYFEVTTLGCRIDGRTAAIENGDASTVDYELHLDRAWHTRNARVTERTATGTRTISLETDGLGHWQVDGDPLDHLDGCLDVDLEASALTNALPIHRLRPAVGDQVQAPAAYVRIMGLRVERLEQTYRRTADSADGGYRFDYAAPVFDFSCRMSYDRSGLVLDYPGIAVRAG